MSKYPGMSTHMVGLIQADATADLQSQVDQLRGELKQRNQDLKNMMETYRYDTDRLRAALEKCVVALENVKAYCHKLSAVGYEQGVVGSTIIDQINRNDALGTSKSVLK